MATNTSAPQQNSSNFQAIEPLFYQEFDTIDPVFEEWTLERMPKNVNTKRIKLDKNQMFGKWVYASYNTKGKFRCLKSYYGPDTDEYGQHWIGGWIQMKIFAQQCKKCDEYATDELDDQRCKNVVKWLHRWIAHMFYGYPFPRQGYQGRRSDQHHLANRCEACAAGWCHYRGNRCQ
ncbi:unnamed protein product [Rotaria sp. Silwood2]|nr:unnamed protein product [Rotaria sp. Silwood2]CAF3106180.1 unnamed protein product [Rotaria sp. Silwood2]CAF3205657.1 unnamed protein product [Rotaria sp. Silwood2]CAF4298950.1 unnamed protein product [Rotaria sp. Silwood2]CAF4408920.1 unnamed protein product [Rotaria sp. Silwood2]